jgi:hypothetical protein
MSFSGQRARPLSGGHRGTRWGPQKQHKKHWWPGGQWEHGDPFPLPGPGASDVPDLQRQQRVRDAIAGLNQLAAAKANSQFSRTKAAHGCRATGMQQRMIDSVVRRIDALGDPPGELTPAGALSDMLASRDLYSQEPANLAVYDSAKLRVTKGDVHPKDARDLLPPEARGMLSRFEAHIELGREELAERLEGCVVPSPYWDPRLRKERHARLELFGTY